MKKIKLVGVLIGSIILIQSTLLMSSRADAIGIDISTWFWWFQTAEIVGGLPLAVLDAAALYLMSKVWGSLDKGSVKWTVLGIVMLLLLIAIPITATPSLVAKQFGQSVNEVLHFAHWWAYPLSWGWTFTLTLLGSLMAFGIGVADSVHTEGKQDSRNNAQKFYDALRETGSTNPLTLAEHSGLSTAVIDKQVRKTQEMFTINGKG